MSQGCNLNFTFPVHQVADYHMLVPGSMPNRQNQVILTALVILGLNVIKLMVVIL